MRVFGAMCGKLGIPIPTQIGQTTLLAALDISRAGPEAADPRVTPLVLGKPLSGKTERQEAAFFWLT